MTLSISPDAAIAAGATDAPLLDLSVGELLARQAHRFPTRAALIVPADASSEASHGERRWTYEELDQEARTTAAALLARFAPGDRVATWACGSAEILLLQLGAALAGVTLVTINPGNRSLEVEYTLATSRARGLFLDRIYRGLDNQVVIEALREVLPALEIVTYLDEWDAFRAQHSEEPLPQVLPSDPALILFTSGSSGKPKAAMLSHRGIVNNAALTARHLEAGEGAVWLNLLPMFHVGGSVTMTLGALASGGTQVLQPQFEAAAVLEAIARYRVELTMAVPTMLVAMLECPEIATVDLSSLKLIVAGGSAVAPDLIRRVRESIGAEVASLMGQTEASGAMFSTRRGDTDEQVSNSVGGPLALSEVKIVDTQDGRVLSRGEPGEICIRSPSTMLCYFEMPERTAEALERDGWLHTGDIGRMRDDGYIQITGRKSDMIIRGGENIYPREIEDVLVSHEDVAQAAVYGLPDERWGEQVAAALVPRAGRNIDTDALTEWLRARIARHRVPRFWQVLDALPLNASGKVQKFILRDEHTQKL
ncbi:class I adenylate-forming enzyme family protein [Novosphingobium sp. 9U]|uniref:class I adenylate-forming enzyme family protein n=1 Tax=Novosphingobium sp. 9U TaxID=2653158 RepID=UPI001356B19B|nr:AMP-binding protein [Novosphingobium sp. 9U]